MKHFPRLGFYPSYLAGPHQLVTLRVLFIPPLISRLPDKASTHGPLDRPRCFGPGSDGGLVPHGPIRKPQTNKHVGGFFAIDPISDDALEILTRLFVSSMRRIMDEKGNKTTALSFFVIMAKGCFPNRSRSRPSSCYQWHPGQDDLRDKRFRILGPELRLAAVLPPLNLDRRYTIIVASRGTDEVPRPRLSRSPVRLTRVHLPSPGAHPPQSPSFVKFQRFGWYRACQALRRPWHQLYLCGYMKSLLWGDLPMDCKVITAFVGPQVALLRLAWPRESLLRPKTWVRVYLWS